MGMTVCQMCVHNTYVHVGFHRTLTYLTRSTRGNGKGKRARSAERCICTWEVTGARYLGIFCREWKSFVSSQIMGTLGIMGANLNTLTFRSIFEKFCIEFGLMRMN